MKQSHLTRALSLALAMLLSLSLLPTAFAAGAAPAFSDVDPGAWYYADVMACAGPGIVAGFADGSFHPNDNVTDTQFITMLTRTFYATQLDAVTTPAGQAWYYPNVTVATDTGMLEKVTLTDMPMKRYDMAMVLFNIIRANDKTAPTTEVNARISEIKDIDIIVQTYKDKLYYATAVMQCYCNGIIGGIDGEFCGDQNMTRAQACAVIVRMMNLINNSNPAATDNTQYDDGTPQVTANTLANGKPITEENVLEILEELKEKYPTGKIWSSNTRYYPDMKLVDTSRQTDIIIGTSSTYLSVFGAVSMQAGCGGFASLVSNAIFGLYDHPMREITDPSKVRAGDIIVHADEKTGMSTHIAVATTNAYTTTTLYGETKWAFKTVEGNCGSQIVWGNSNINISYYSNGNPTIRVFTRYPD